MFDYAMIREKVRTGNSLERLKAISQVRVTFTINKDKDQAWEELQVLAKDKYSFMRKRAAVILRSAFPHITDKDQGWKDLLVLAKDEDCDVRWRAADTLGAAFPHITDKDQGWKDLLVLAKDEDSDVRTHADRALGSAFPHITDKDQVTKELLALAKDEDSGVRSSAYYSLGKTSIYWATNAEDDDTLQKEFECAIGFFEISIQEVYWPSNPAKFCLSFYQSYYSVIYRKQEAEEEVKKNLEEAKHAVSGSESKEKLLEAVENLSNALNEAQKLRDLDDIKADLNGYRRYCDRACELLDSTEDTAPRATLLVGRGLPVIDEQIQGMLAEIGEKAEVICKESQGTPFEGFGKEVHKTSQDLLNVRDPIALEKQIDNMLISFAPVCEKMSEIDEEACKLYQKAQQEQYVEDKISLINMILSKIPYHMLDMKNVTINQAPNSRAYINSEDMSINMSGDLHLDFENLKLLIENEYSNSDKEELIEATKLMKQSLKNPSKKEGVKEKLGWIISKTSEFSSISSFALSLLEKIN